MSGDWQRSLQLLEDMTESGIPPDNVAYNTVLSICTFLLCQSRSPFNEMFGLFVISLLDGGAASGGFSFQAKGALANLFGDANFACLEYSSSLSIQRGAAFFSNFVCTNFY